MRVVRPKSCNISEMLQDSELAIIKQSTVATDHYQEMLN